MGCVQSTEQGAGEDGTWAERDVDPLSTRRFHTVPTPHTLLVPAGGRLPRLQAAPLLPPPGVRAAAAAAAPLLAPALTPSQLRALKQAAAWDRRALDLVAQGKHRGLAALLACHPPA